MRRGSARDLRQRLARKLKRVRVALPIETIDALARYFELLATWNEKVNLTGLSNPEEALDRLLLEPAVASRYFPEQGSLLDVGSGGGSPAIPLKLVHPGLALWMVEAKTRKSAFLREVVRQLNLADVQVETARYEELLTRPELHEGMDAVSLRAVRVEGKALRGLQAFLRPGGRLFLFRGPSGADVPVELTPPLAWETTHPLVESLRSRLVVIRKEAVGHQQS
jgi:16S rRNA (guanine527-N7)-methyltransferase